MHKSMFKPQMSPVEPPPELHFVPYLPPESLPPTHEEIARSAYGIYVANGRISGQSDANWQQAELSLSDRSLAPCSCPLHDTTTYVSHVIGLRRL